MNLEHMTDGTWASAILFAIALGCALGWLYVALAAWVRWRGGPRL